MTPLERLLAESIPTGTFGHAQPTTPRPTEHTSHWTPAEQAAHVHALEAELDSWEWDRNTRREQRRHLRLVHAAEAA
ncbi:hypothetical protein [Streptomyces sp. LN704]|uniref:hypothetical protein n=1 Tax=Streptomyces sp. LN704 TaxID=3112982 RepID=UPI003713D6D4